MHDVDVKHWVDVLAENLASKRIEEHVINGGMAASGRIHIGKTRGEIFLQAAVANRLRKMGEKVKHLLVVYTQDPLKAKPPLITKKFEDEWKGVRILDVPCPEECCKNWVEHWMNPFYETYKEYDIGDIIFVETSKVYEMTEMTEVIKTYINKRDIVREVLNRYRGQKYGKDWIPFKPLCPKCKNISTTKAISANIEKEEAEYECPRCRSKGKVKLNEGKLEWRLEWAALWKVLKVTFEPYGKDHAAAGGSRDTCTALAKEILEIEPPEGFPYEWVYLDGEAMSSSGGISFDFSEWNKVANPHVLKYWYYVSKPMTHLEFSVSKIPQLCEEYEKAERIYYGLESIRDKKVEKIMKRSYELAHNEKPPKEMPLQIPYTFSIILVQVVPEGDEQLNEIINRLIKTGHLKVKLDQENLDRIRTIINRAKYYVEKYAPEEMKIKVLQEIPMEILNSISLEEREFLNKLSDVYLSRKFTPNELEAKIVEIARSMNLDIKSVFRTMYRILLGRDSGPRLAPFMLSLNDEFVIKRLKLIS
ncbi:MAG: lysine--tRNA ligase [Candidatus Methanomethylicia archaeon]|nr:lysine--tRNA ligase [Candidatus Methanomethylicia archaeon]MCX8168869.1 lysine--tRNA ligase [Candidatus Methanomethylicia archaeon]MDW7988601.1 lysine--tRNA ligase [Nitrososphaerota archaeon]